VAKIDKIFWLKPLFSNKLGIIPILIILLTSMILINSQSALVFAETNTLESEPHQPPYVISDDVSGGDCEYFAEWDYTAKTCTLTNDLFFNGTSGIIIDDSEITLDGNGYTLMGNFSYFNPGKLKQGVLIEGKTGVTVKNLAVESFNIGVHLVYSIGNTIQENSFTNNGHTIRLDHSHSNDILSNMLVSKDSIGFMLDKSNSNEIKGNIQSGASYGLLASNSNSGIISGNTFKSNGNSGIYLIGVSGYTINDNLIESSKTQGIQIDGGGSHQIIENIIKSNGYSGIRLTSSANIISSNIISSNIAEGILVLSGSNIQSKNNEIKENEISYNGLGISMHGESNSVYNNNFIDNTIQAKVAGPSSGTIFNLQAPIGGNYWNNFDTHEEGCYNLFPKDQFCDDPYVFSGGQDNLPWTNAEYEIPILPPIPEPEPDPILIPEPDEKNTICHVPPGNQDNPQTITISENAWQAHEKHGDIMGECLSITPEINQIELTNSTDQNNSNFTDSEFLAFADIDSLLSSEKELEENPVISAEELINEQLLLLASTDFNEMKEDFAMIYKFQEYLKEATKAERDAFKNKFLKSLYDMKLHLGKNILSDRFLDNLEMAELKFDIALSKINKEEERKNQINSAVELVKIKKELIETRNELGVAKFLPKSYPDKDDIIQELQDRSNSLLKEYIVTEEESKGKQLTQEDLEKIDEKIIELTTEREIPQKTSDDSGSNNLLNYLQDKGITNTTSYINSTSTNSTDTQPTLLKITQVSTTQTISGPTSLGIIVNCPTGMIPISGAYQIMGISSQEVHEQIHIAGESFFDETYQLTVTVINATENFDVRAIAYCTEEFVTQTSDNTGITKVTSSLMLSGPTSSAVQVNCPDGMTPFSGGYLISGISSQEVHEQIHIAGESYFGNTYQITVTIIGDTDPLEILVNAFCFGEQVQGFLPVEITKVSSVETISGAVSIGIQTYCPAGTVPFSGGYLISGISSQEVHEQIHIAGESFFDDTYQLTVTVIGQTDPFDVTAIAHCVNVDLDYA